MNQMQITPVARQLNRCYVWIIVLSIITSCSVSKYIPEDRALYTGSSIKVQAEGKIEDKSELVDELHELVRPKPNSKILGWRLPLLVHYKEKFGKIGFINRFLNKKIGEPPVYMDDLNLPKSEDLLLNHLQNNGYFKSEIQSSSQIKRQHGKVTYEINLDSPYVLNQYVLDTSELPIHKDIKIALKNTPIEPDQRFALSRLKAERTRIDDHLKSLGYYNFNGDYLIFEADTNLHDSKQFNLYLRLKQEVPEKALVPYTIESISVYPNYSLGQSDANQDTVQIDGVDFIQEGEFFKPHLLTAYVLLRKGERYTPKASKLTSQQFSSLGTYRFVNIRHDEINNQNTTGTAGQLATSIYLSPLNKRSLKAEMQAVVKSNNFAGPALMLTYSNRNLFRGGELLQINGKMAYESQLTKDQFGNLNSTQFGLNADLIIPRLVPFRPMARYEYDVPKTKISVGIEYLNRSELYLLRTISSTYGYTWNTSRYISHEFNPVNLNLVDLTNTTPRFNEILESNPFLSNSFEQRFIGGMTYNFTFNQMTNAQVKHPFYVNVNAEVAGNGLNLVSNGYNAEGKATFLGLEFAQYAKSSVDVRYQLPLGRTHRLVSRVFAGLGMAYGNSEVMPFSRQFFSGGPYSVRAFSIRSLGPGSYSPDGDNVDSFFDQAGDIRLEFNTEYRFPIYSILKGAVFVDAGNVWLRNENASLPGGQFSNDFIRELGLGTGFGLRIDVQNFVIRGDLAAPLSKPYLPRGERFGFDYQHPVFNFAIGYPF